MQLVRHVLRLFLLHSWETRSLDLHNTAPSERERKERVFATEENGPQPASPPLPPARAAGPSPVQQPAGPGPPWAEMPFYNSKKPPESAFLVSKGGL